MSDAMFRQLNRVSVCLPVRVTLRSDPVRVGQSIWRMNPEIEHTLTENVSSGGCYFFLSEEPPLGTRLEMEVTIPGEVPEVPFARICCQGKVIRVDQDTTDPEQPRFGVAATIERLQDVSIEAIPTPSGHAAGAAIAREGDPICAVTPSGNAR